MSSQSIVPSGTETKPSHTPGPWQRNIKPATKYPTVFAGRNTHIAVLRVDPPISSEEAEANINLICAAPDLLEAAKEALELGDLACEGEFLYKKGDRDGFNQIKTKEDAILAKLRAAIEKAEGAQS